MSGNLSAQIPAAPLVDLTTGQITPPWRAFLLALYTRTGNTSAQLAPLQQSIAAEQTARMHADTTLQAAIDAEGLTRANWAASDLSGLPTSNPGGGRPYLVGHTVTVGP